MLGSSVRAALIPRPHELWPLLLGPVLILFVYLAESLGWDWVQSKYVHEFAALILTPIAFALFAWKMYSRKSHKELAQKSIYEMIEKI